MKIINKLSRLMSAAYEGMYNIEVNKNDVLVSYVFDSTVHDGGFTVNVPIFHFKVCKDVDLLTVLLVSLVNKNPRMRTATEDDVERIVQYARKKFKCNKRKVGDLRQFASQIAGNTFTVIEHGKRVNLKTTITI